MLKIAVVSASSQKGAQSLRVAQDLQRRLNLLATEIKTELIDLHQLSLPIFASRYSDNDWTKRLEVALSQLDNIAGLVLVTPEWNGSANPAWANLLLYVGDRLAHRPVFAVGVSAGRGGAYPLVDVRAHGYKDTGYLILPESLIVSHCQQAFDENDHLVGEPGQLADRLLAVFYQYAQSLVVLREKLKPE